MQAKVAGKIKAERLTFDSTQRRDLKALGLCEEQIKALERHALSGIRFLAQPMPTLGEMRELLKNLGDSLDQTALFARRIEASGEGSAAHGVWKAILQAAFSEGLDEEILLSHLGEIEKLRRVMRGAIGNLPKEQVRQTASPMSIGMIVEALQAGGDEAMAAGRTAATFRPSCSGDFVSIVDLCFQAAGKEGSQERAIKAYIKNAKARDSSH